MQFNSTPVQARLQFSPRTLCLALLASGLIGALQPAHAQAASAPAGKEDAAPSERAKREAENVFRWIMIHSDKPRKTRDDKPAAAAPAPVANAPRPAPAARVAKVGEGSAEGSVVAPAPAPAARTAAAPAAVATPAAAAAVPVSNVDNEAARMTNSAAALARGNGSGSTGPGGHTAMPDAAAPPVLATAPEPEAEQETLVMVSQVEPQFPRAVMLDLRRGTVRVRFDVMPDGSVSAPNVVSTTNVRLNRAALAAVGQWKFQPVREAQEGVVELGFNLD
ncbi:TonB family protein [Rhizobacter sp. OV335]|uniref:TonB family protein n=1 Tax=Rhizobacter sp. OV335 TaxID=1500264 RepID=UPI0009114438|nr:TonB family protein [Rhizobacter sp. OV335]SHN14870.1 TonB family C-terminal domain-containing protein [Rhizobacter sp. OV335]